MKHMAYSSLFLAAASLTLAAPSPTQAADGPNFAGKTITVLLGSTTGGTTDSSTRLMSSFLARKLPGKPSIVVQNKPGAHGITAMNYFTQQVKPDGLTAIAGSNSQINPLTYRVKQAKYDPTKFNMIGGINIGGTVLIVRTESLPRLTNKATAPLTMGSVAGLPQTGMQMAAWGIDYLGWNAKWVSGYRGVPPLILALQRGEVDMTAFATTFLNGDLLDKRKFTILYQSGSGSGTVPSKMEAIAGIPMFPEPMQGKISDPLAQKAFNFWRDISSVVIWMALPPNTASGVVETYRTAFTQAIADPEFMKHGAKFSGDITAVSADGVMKIAHSLAEITPEGLGFMGNMLRRQGLKLEKAKKKRAKKE